MLRTICSLFSLFVIPAVVLMTPLTAQSDPTNLEEVDRMKAGHKKVEGVVTEVKSGLYTVKTSTGATLTLTEAAAVRHGLSAPKVGDELTLWVNEGNMVMDVRPKGQPGKGPRFITGTRAAIDHGKSKMTLSASGGEESFNLRPESRMFRDIPVGTEVTIEAMTRERSSTFIGRKSKAFSSERGILNWRTPRNVLTSHILYVGRASAVFRDEGF